MSCLIRYNPAGSILLPQGYTRLVYIEGNADAWFSAGIAATANTKYKIKFSAKNKGSWNMMFGRWPNCDIGITLSMHLYINGSNVGAIKEDEICDVTASSSAVYFKSKNSITCNKVSAHAVKLAVFGGTSDGDTNNPWGYGKGRIYELKIWEGNTLIRDYIPAKNSNGVAGLLDLVDNSWHPSSTSTLFKAGPEIPQGFPTSEYCLVEWLESTGTLWIDTDTVTTSNLQLDLEFQLTNNAVQDTRLFGTRSAGQYYDIYCGDGANNIKGLSKINTSNSVAIFGPKDLNKHTIIYNRYSDRKCLFDGVVKFTMSEDSTTGTRKARLFDSYGSAKAHMKLYMCKLYNSGTLIKNFIPCYRRSDMKPGLYDIVGRKFYTNQGTGEFLLGPSITFGWGEVVNNVGAEAHPMFGTLYTETNKFTHTGKNKDDSRTLPVYQRVEPEQLISISFDTDVTLWASHHDTSGGTTNKGKWSMWIYFNKVYNPNNDSWNSAVCYAASLIKSLGGTRWKYSFTVPADMHMMRVRTNLYSDGSTSYTAHFWNFNWSFGDTGCQVNPLHAIPYNISTAGKLSSPYDQSIYTEPDGSKWIRIFHHADPTTYKFASTNPFTTCFKTDDRRWWAIPICNDVKGSWELMCKEKGTSSDTERKFRWILNTNPMDGDFASTASSKITRNTSSGYMTNTYGGLYRFNNNCYIVANNGINGNWYGAFGSWSAYNEGIPSFSDKATIKDGGYKDLYLRIPENQEQVFYLDSTGYIDAGQVGLESMFNTRQWTIAMWFNPSTLSSNAEYGANSNLLFVYRKEGDNNATHLLSIHLTKTKVGTSFWGDDHLFTIPNYTANKWYHLTVTQNGATQTVYINGVSIGTASKGALDLQSGSRMSFGYNPTRPLDAPKKFYGKILDILIWDEIKNPAELM